MQKAEDQLGGGEEAEEGEDLCDCEFSLAYGAKILLNNAKLHLKRGKLYGLCGPNGAGKVHSHGVILLMPAMVLDYRSSVCSVVSESACRIAVLIVQPQPQLLHQLVPCPAHTDLSC